jgi:D-alanyl-D-alanine dipeptidase
VRAQVAGPGEQADSLSGYEKQLVAGGFVDVKQIDSSLIVELKYACEDNFMKADVYGELRRCYLRRDAAEKLAAANAILKSRRPEFRILIADGFRPRRVQRRMWSLVKGTPMQRYVANPRWGSMHNYGCAVDVTIADTTGRRLDMGTPIDYFGALAQPRLEKQYRKNGQLSREQVENRRLLRTVMRQAGFHPIAIEWWHFNAFEKDSVRARYAIVE